MTWLFITATTLLILLVIRWRGLCRKEYILTPPPPPIPRINGPRVIGQRPGSDFLYRIPVSGERPMNFSAAALPPGLVLDPDSGLITGAMERTGIWKVPLRAVNRSGEAAATLEIRCGEENFLTPPLGWNSWYCWSESVSDANIRGAADAMVESGLADHGWSYINIDDCWQGVRGGPHGAIQGNEKFPDMKSLCDHIHSMGLKAGIYSTPWISSYAGFIGGSEPDEGYETFSLSEEKRRQPGQLFGRYPRPIRKGLGRVGSLWHGESDARQWGDWGFDFLKCDWKPNDIETTEKIHGELKRLPRDIFLSLSNTAPLKNAPGLSRLANSWRTTGDIIDRWWSVSRIISQQKRWLSFGAPGHYNDPDMLQVGSFGIPNRDTGQVRKTRLLPDEQYSQVSLWAVMGAPLILSCDISRLDDFTRSLLTNDEVLAVNQDAGSMEPRVISSGFMREAWLRELSDGSLAVCFLNRFPFPCRTGLKLQKAGLKGKWQARDLWRQKDLGEVEGEVKAIVPGHGVVFLKLSPLK